MKFPRVQIENFLAISDAEFSLDGLGLVHVSGETDETSADSNGAGKSSIGDAISWCIWGETAREVSGDDVINVTVGKNCCVITDIDDNGEMYRVGRYRKHTRSKNGNKLTLEKQDDQGAWVNLTKGTTALTQKAIERLLGCSKEVFNAANYFGQENMPDIPNMTDRELKVLVEQAAGVDVLTNAYSVARDDAREASEKVSLAQIEFDRINARLNDAKASQQRLSDEYNAWATKQKSIIADYEKRTRDTITDFTKAKEEFDASVEQELQEKIKESDDKIASVQQERDRENQLGNDLHQLSASFTKLEAQVAAEERALEAAKRMVDNAKRELADVEAGEGKPCSACTRPLEKGHLQAAIDKASLRVEAAEKDMQTCMDRLAAVKTKVDPTKQAVEKARKALNDHVASMTDVSGETAKLKNLQFELSVVRNTKREIDRLKEQATNLGASWKTEAARVNPFKDVIEQNDKSILDFAKSLENAKQVLAAANLENRYAQAVVDIYSPAGVRARRLDEATPYLNERTAHYLGALSDGAIEAYWTTLTENKSGKKELREKFSVTVEKAGAAPSFKGLSGGEKRKVRLACALALQDLVSTRASKSIELWIGDEVDDALDDAGLERLMGILEEKAKERGTVLVISHNDIAHYARRQITVKKQNGLSKVIVQ